MTPLDQLIRFLIGLTRDPWAIVKVLFLIGLAIYFAFALIVVRQVKLMCRTLDVSFEFLLRILTWAHLALAVFVFLLALLVL